MPLTLFSIAATGGPIVSVRSIYQFGEDVAVRSWTSRPTALENGSRDDIVELPS